MSPFIERIKAFVPHIPSQHERDAQYLAASVDAADVERRLWEIDHRSPQRGNAGLGGALH